MNIINIHLLNISVSTQKFLIFKRATDVLAVVIFILLIWWVFRYWNMKKRYWKYFDEIPGPVPLPFIGNTIELNVDHNELYRRLIGMRLLWGSRKGINKAWFGQRPYIFVSKANTVEPILSSNRHIDKSSDYQYLHSWLGTGLLTSTGKKWYARRKILTPTFHFKILEDFLEVFGEQTEILIEKMSREIGRERFDIFPYITLCTLDIICETAMGRHVFAQENSDSIYVRAVCEIVDIIQTRQATLWWHSDFLFRLTSLYRKHQNCIRILHDFSRRVISERRRDVEYEKSINNENIIYEKAGKRKRLAFLDLLLKMSVNGSSLSDESIREEVDTFMFEGHDTTSSAVCWTLYLLGCYPDIQERVVREINEIFSVGDYQRRATMQDLKNMIYLERCIKETLRLYPSAPILARQIAENITIGEYTVPKGTTAMVIIPVLHRDPEVFPNPERFDPDRFLPENCNGRHPYAYIPFSAGPRNCIGQKFAMLEEKVIISGILKKYKIEAMERREDICITAELITRATNGLHIKITPRV